MTAPNSGSIDLGTVIVAAGALITTVATFLPLEESPSWRTIEHNTLIQQHGWALIALALATAFSAYQAGSGRSDKWWVPLIWIGITAVLLFTETQVSHTLYPVKDDGSVDTSGPSVVGSLGIAVYVAWLGVAVMALGTRFLRDSVRRRKTSGAS
jgi:hypothetical protein